MESSAKQSAAERNIAADSGLAWDLDRSLFVQRRGKTFFAFHASHESRTGSDRRLENRLRVPLSRGGRGHGAYLSRSKADRNATQGVHATAGLHGAVVP